MPNVSWNDIGGSEELKLEIQQVENPVFYSDYPQSTHIHLLCLLTFRGVVEKKKSGVSQISEYE